MSNYSYHFLMIREVREDINVLGVHMTKAFRTDQKKKNL